MSVVHLATRDDWTLCQSSAARPVTTGSPIVLTCKRGIIGSLAVYLHESGYTRPETSAAA